MTTENQEEMGPIKKALWTCNERFKAATEMIAISDRALGAGLTNEQVKKMVEGTEIDPEELLELSEDHSLLMMENILQGVPLSLLLPGIFFQAFLTGVEFQRAQDENKNS